MKKNRKNKILLLLFSLILFFIIIKIFNFINIRNDVNEINNTSFKKYLRIYSLTEGKAPINIFELKKYIKHRDLVLYNKIKNIELKFMNDDFGGKYYLVGFDGVNDSLKKTYKLNNVGFFSSIFIKGDLEIDLFYDIRKKANIFYRIEKDSLIKLKTINPLDFYRSKLKCNRIKKDDSDSQKTYFTEIVIRKGFVSCYYNNGLSKKSIEVILEGIKKNEISKDNKNFYYIFLMMPNFENFDCE